MAVCFKVYLNANLLSNLHWPKASVSSIHKNCLETANLSVGIDKKLNQTYARWLRVRDIGIERYKGGKVLSPPTNN